MCSSASLALNSYAGTILNVFRSYAFVYASERLKDDDPLDVLPLSGNLPHDSRHADNSLFSKSLASTAVHLTVRCPFIATSGHNDKFHTATELACTARRGLHLNAQAIPALDHLTDGTQPLNAYLFDFYQHGQVAALVRDNGIRLGEMWYLLDDFVLTLKTIQAGIQEMLVSPVSSPEPQLGRAPPVVQKKTTSGRVASTRPVADAWDDDEEGDETLPICTPSAPVFDSPAPSAVPDSGYGSADVDEGAMSDGDGMEADVLRNKPKAMSDRDWKVLQVITELTEEFDAKFRKMWAR